MSAVAPTQAGPGAQRLVARSESVTLPKSRWPLVLAIGCGTGALLGTAAALALLLSDDLFAVPIDAGDGTTLTPTGPGNVAPPQIAPLEPAFPVPVPSAPRDPFAEGAEPPVPDELRALHTKVIEERRLTTAELALLRARTAVRGDDPLPHIILGNALANRREYLDENGAFAQYDQALVADPSVRGEPHMSRHVLEAAVADNADVRARAAAFVRTNYGREAIPAIQFSMSRRPRAERERLAALLRSLEEAP